MNTTMRTRLLGFGYVAMLAALPMLAQEHKWAGRTLSDLNREEERMLTQLAIELDARHHAAVLEVGRELDGS